MKLINYVNLGDKTNAQAIYSSQLYGTYFSIYALIDTEEFTDSKEYDYELKSIKLFIMNYKGIINLGITRAIIEPILDDKNIQVAAKLDIEVQGKFEMINDLFPVEIDPNFKGIKKESTINTARYLRPMHIGIDEDSSHQNRDTPLSSGIFDTEFYYREGQILRDKMVRTEYISKTWANRKITNSAKGGHLCPFATSIVV